MGLLWLSTVPLTNALVAQIFGAEARVDAARARYSSATRSAASCGAYLGGVIFTRQGSYDLAWWISIGLGIFAALVCAPIDEQPLARARARAGMNPRTRQALVGFIAMLRLRGAVVAHLPRLPHARDDGVLPQLQMVLLARGFAPFALALALCLRAAEPSPQAIDIPPWFEKSFLDFPDDVKEAAAQGKRVMIYFGQDGCPYCKRLMEANFSQREIVEQTQRRFVAVALNLWGDRETVWIDGAKRTEKELGTFLRVQFTPTLLFLDERGAVVHRLNGYQPPARFRSAMRYASEARAGGEDFGAFLQRNPVRESARAAPEPGRLPRAADAHLPAPARADVGPLREPRLRALRGAASGHACEAVARAGEAARCRAGRCARQA